VVRNTTPEKADPAVLLGRKKPLATLAAAALGGAIAIALSGTASAGTAAAAASGTWSSSGGVFVNNGVDGKTNILVAHLSLTINGQAEVAYCIDFSHDLSSAAKTYDEKNWSDATYPTTDALAKIKWVLGHGYPSETAAQLLADSGSSLPTSDAKINDVVYAGTQTAIWSFSDPTLFKLGAYDESKQGAQRFTADEYAAVTAIYHHLTTDAKSESTDAPGSLTISPATATGVVGAKVGPFTVKSNVGDATIKVTGGKAVDKNGKDVTTVADGGQFYVVADAVGPVTIAATAEGTVPTGRIFVAHDGAKSHQELVLAGTAGVPLEAAAAATVTAAPSPSPSASTPPSLPVTGSKTGLWAGLGLLLILGGAALVLVLRRRRVRFVA
jgi:TQXA domain-containing protein/LPXTG-motif cell wall-anchored protein